MLFQLINNLFKEAKPVQAGTLSRREQKRDSEVLLTLQFASLHCVGGECPVLGINIPGFGSWGGEDDKHNFNWVGKHLVGLICFKMP